MGQRYLWEVARRTTYSGDGLKSTKRRDYDGCQAQEGEIHSHTAHCRAQACVQPGWQVAEIQSEQLAGVQIAGHGQMPQQQPIPFLDLRQWEAGSSLGAQSFPVQLAQLDCMEQA